MAYALRHGQVVIPLREGRNLIGRAPSAIVRLDDAKVSRRHAAVFTSYAGAFIEDLHSKSGVIVDGQRIQSRHRLQPGARICIGDCELSVEIELDGAPDGFAAGTLTDIGSSFAGHRDAAMQLLADGNMDDARSLVAADLSAATLRADRGEHISAADLEGTARCALQLARSTLEPHWVDHLLEMYESARAPIPTEILADLHATVPAVAPIAASRLRSYLEVAKQVSSAKTPSGERLQRSLEALLPHTRE